MKIIILLGLVILLAAVNIRAEEYISYPIKSNIWSDGSTYIDKSGKYCLQGDINTHKEFDIHAGSFKNPGPVITVNSNNVEIDLQQHLLQSQSVYATGLALYGENNILITNGKVRAIGLGSSAVSGGKALRTGIHYADSLSCNISFWCQDISYLDSVDKMPPKYMDTNITHDKMSIFSTYRGVQLSGNHNIIRNSTIEVDDNTAIYLMGQYPVIENNTIIIHSNKNTNKEYQKKLKGKIKDGAIKLRDAKGGIIRNNRIIYKGGLFGGKAPVAINLLDSKDVLIEGNTIEGFDKLVRENGETSLTENNNMIQ